MICDLCGLDLGIQTEFNFNKHRDSRTCKENQNKKKPLSQCTNLLTYFKPVPLKSSGKGYYKDIFWLLNIIFAF